MRRNLIFLRTQHYIALAAALCITALLYWGVNTIPPKKASPATVAADAPHSHAIPGGTSVEAASLEDIAAASRKTLPVHAVQSLETLEHNINNLHDSAAMVPIMEEISKLWQEHKQFSMAGFMKARAAHLAHSEKKLNFAGQFFLDIMHQDGEPAVHMWEAQQAVSCFNEALEINPNNDTTKLALASGYIDGTGEVMKGVGILRGITAEHPDHIPANLMLGRMSIQSGQFDKAVTRFETVLKKEPANREALYFLAEAYKGKGDKQKEIALFEQCKKVVNNPAFSKDVDEYINTFK